jgi:hypothetical protein
MMFGRAGPWRGCMANGSLVTVPTYVVALDRGCIVGTDTACGCAEDYSVGRIDGKHSSYSRLPIRDLRTLSGQIGTLELNLTST